MTFNRPLFVAKLKALAAHLLISVVLVGIALALMWWHWFPAPLFVTDGGGVGLKLLLLVDLVLGPLLTLVVFNPAKGRRQIALDLGVIALLQLAAYGAGLWSIHSVRVQAVAFHQGIFQAVTAPLYKDQTIAPESWDALGAGAPYLVNVREPEPGDEAGGVTAFGFMSGLEPYQLQFLYQPLSAVLPQVRAQGWTLAALQASHPELAVRAGQWLQRHAEVAADQARFYRLEGYYGHAVLVLDGQGRWQGGFRGELPKLTASSPSPRS